MNRAALHKISYGLYIVSSRKGERFNGQIANTVVQVTSRPPTIAISINKENLTYECIQASGVFSVSILGQSAPPALIGLFGFQSGRNVDKFAGMDFRVGVTGAPIVLRHAVAYLEAQVRGDLDCGSHAILLGEVLEGEVLAAEEPLTYAFYQEVRGGRSPKTAPTYSGEEPKTAAASAAAPSYVCSVCGYVYDPAQGDPEHGVSPGTAFPDLPETWTCPICGADKSQFSPAA